MVPTSLHLLLIDCFSESKYTLTPKEWHFIGFSFDSASKKGYIVVDDTVRPEDEL